MLNLFQHLPKFRRLRVMPAMTGALQKGFLEVPLRFHFSFSLKTGFFAIELSEK